MLHRLVLVPLILLSTAAAQYWEPSSAPVSVLEGPTEYRGVVSKTAYPDGKLLVSTSYGVLNAKPVQGWLTRLNSDGSTDPTFTVPAADGRVLLVWPDGRILCAIRSGDLNVYQIKRLLDDGTDDPTFTPFEIHAARLEATMLADGDVLLFGHFSIKTGSVRHNLARLNPDGSVDAGFLSPFVEAQTAGVVAAVAPVPDGSLFISGNFGTLGANRTRVAKLTSNGAVAPAFGIGHITLPYAPSALFLAAGGGIVTFESTTTGLRRFDATGSPDLTFVPTFVGQLRSVGQQLSDGTIYCITSVFGSPPTDQLRRLTSEFADDPSFTPVAIPYNGDSLGLPVAAHDGSLYVGPVTPERAVARLGITHVLANGVIDPGFNPRFSHLPPVTAHIRLADGKELIAGRFDYINGAPQPADFDLVRLLADGTVDDDFHVALPSLSQIHKLFVQTDGKVLATGAFQFADGTFSRAVRFHANGDLDEGYGKSEFFSYWTALDGQDRLYAATNNGAGEMLRYDVNGQLDAGFHGQFLGGLSRWIVPLPDGKVLAGMLGRIVRLLPNGAQDPSFVPIALQNQLQGLVGLPDGSAIVCTQEGVAGHGVSQIHVQRLPADATSDGSLAGDFFYASRPFRDTIVPEDIRLAVAGVIFDLLCESSPDALGRLGVDFSFGPLRMTLDCWTDGKWSMAEAPGDAGSRFAHYTRTATTGPSFDPAPYFVGLAPSPWASAIPLNYPWSVRVFTAGLAPFSYVWKRNGSVIAGTDAVLHLPHIQTADEGNYSVTVANGYGSAGSSSVNLTVDESQSAAMVVAGPVDQRSPRGETVTLTVLARGNPALIYHWYLNDELLGGGGPSLVLPDVQLAQAGRYHVVVTNVVKIDSFSFVVTETSQSATLTVFDPIHDVAPSLASEPDSRQVPAGGTTEFRVVALGTPAPEYQWQKQEVAGGGWVDLSDGGRYAGSRSDRLTIANASLLNDTGDRFRCVVSNRVGSVTSQGATLEVLRPAFDFNGDGHVDVLWQNTATGQRALWLMNGGDFTPLSVVSLGWVDPAWSMADATDFNGDGNLDILWQNTLTGQRALWLMNGGDFTPRGIVSLGWVDPAWSMAGATDFNGDGNVDILWQNTVTGQRALWLMNGGDFSPTGIVSLGWVDPAWAMADATDFNGDGTVDILWQNTVTGQRALWLMNGGDFTPTSIVSLGWVDPAWSMAGATDFNGDGTIDILWQNTVTGQRALWLMNGGDFTPTGVMNLGFVPIEWRMAK